MDSLIYEKLKIDLHSVSAELIKEYLQVKYWLNLASKPSSANLCRYKMAAQHLSNAGDFARLQQLCAEVPELKNLVFVSEPVGNEPTATDQVRGGNFTASRYLPRLLPYRGCSPLLFHIITLFQIGKKSSSYW